MKNKSWGLIVSMLAIGMLLSSSLGAATPISSIESEVNWDEIDDIWQTDGLYIGDTADVMDMNATRWDVIAETGVMVNITMEGDLIEFVLSGSGSIDSVLIVMYYFPEFDGVEFVDNHNCTIILHELVATFPAYCQTTVFYMDYDAYVSFDWLDSLSDLAVFGGVIVQDGVNIIIDAGLSNRTITTIVDPVTWDITGDPDEQLVFYAFGGTGTFANAEYIDFWPDYLELGTGINPLADGAAAYPDIFEDLYDIFYPVQSTTTTSQSGGGVHHHASTTSTTSSTIDGFVLQLALNQTWMIGLVMLLGITILAFLLLRKPKRGRKH
jgi:hypothetical protein